MLTQYTTNIQFKNVINDLTKGLTNIVNIRVGIKYSLYQLNV